MNILIVRLGALGDVIHAVPAAAALRRAYPAARIDWLVEARHRAIVDLVTTVDRVVVVERATWDGWTAAIRELRKIAYDVAIDLQGLMKSAVFARASGAPRVIGFSIWHLREKTARPFYTTTAEPEMTHVIRRNLQLLRAVDVNDDEIRFPLSTPPSAALDRVRLQAGDRPFALINPGAAWPNKRWPPERFGEVASFVSDACGVAPFVTWGPGEESLAQSVVAASGGAARLAPATTIADLVALSRAAALVVSGDTGPLHIATAVGTPTVGLFGPTDPARNGAWSDADVSVSMYDRCGCHYARRCHEPRWCLADVTTPEVCAAIQRRVSSARTHE